MATTTGMPHGTSRRLPFRGSLKTQLIIVCCLLLLIGTGVRNAAVTVLLQGELRTQVEAQILSIAQYAAREVDAKIAERQDTLTRLATAFPPSLFHRPRDATRWLAEHQEIHPLFSRGLILIGADGRAVADYPAVPGRAGISYADRDWFKTARNDGIPTMGPPTIGRATREPVLGLAAPVKDAGGRVIGVLAGICALSAPGFLDLLQQGRVGEQGGFLLISPQDKLFVAASDASMVLKPTPAPGVNLLHDRAMAGYRGTGITINARGIEELSAMVTIPRTGWFLVARIPTAEAFAPVEQVRQQVLRNNLLIGLIAVVALFFGLRWVFRPLTNAADQVRAMADGRLELAPLPVVRADEVGALAAGFNRLLEQLQQREAILAQLAHHDALTTLPNRIALLDRMEQSLALAERQGSGLALLFVDLDGFKPVNDLHGHEVGDQILRQVAERLRDCVRKADMVARYGGDEFVILLTDVATRDGAGAVAEKCIAALALPFRNGPLTVRIGASIGVALYPVHAKSADSLLAEADTAMYRAKHAGRNAYRFPGADDTSLPSAQPATDIQ